MKVRSCRPRPSLSPAGSSPMIAPMTLAVAEILSAVKMNGSAAGTWSFHSSWPGRAAYDRNISTLLAGGERRPRRVLIVVTGKNVR